MSTPSHGTDDAPARRSHRVLLALYPPSFQERYGDELSALLDDTGLGPRVVLDLLLGAARAWLRPSYGGDPLTARRMRLISSVSAVWTGFCVVLCGTLGTLRVLEDPAVPGLALESPRWVAFHQAASIALLLSCLLVLVAGVPLGIRVLRSGRPARRAALGPVIALAVLLAMFAVVFAGLVRVDTPPYPLWLDVVGGAALLLVPVVAAWWTFALPVALRRASPRSRDLVTSAALGLVVAALLTVPVLLVAAVAYRTIRFWGMSEDSVLIAACVAGVVVGWLLAAVSSVRGAPAIRGVRT